MKLYKSTLFSIGNTAIGYQALKGVLTGSSNTAVGFSALSSNTSGEKNVAIGNTAGDNLVSGNNNIIIGGNDIDFPNATGSNQLVIGNIIYGDNIDGSGSAISSGGIGIGAVNPSPGGTNGGAERRLYVSGNAEFTGNIQVGIAGSTIPDYVFQKYFDGFSTLKDDYTMKSLEEVEAFVKEHKHLPGVPSAAEVEAQGGIILNKAALVQLEKIEELFLHTIEQQKTIKTLENENKMLKERLAKIEAALGLDKK